MTTPNGVPITLCRECRIKAGWTVEWCFAREVSHV